MTTTTLRVSLPVKRELAKFKNFEREPFDDVIKRLLNVAREEPLSREEIMQIEASLEEIKKGRVLSLKDAEKKWGV
ncbi:MAG: hypothetical protein QXK06_01970 [Candidatus Diapherotrites archaeon]